MAEDTMVLLDPGAEGLPSFTPTASRLKELDGKHVGLLDNIKHNSEYLLAAIEAELRRRFDCRVQTVRKKTYTKLAEPEVLASLEQCDAVITAVGD